MPLASVATLLLSLAIRAASHMIGVTAVAGAGGQRAADRRGVRRVVSVSGLGVGGAEQLASYPGSLWTLMIGIIAMLNSRSWQGFTVDARPQ